MSRQLADLGGVRTAEVYRDRAGRGATAFRTREIVEAIEAENASGL